MAWDEGFTVRREEALWPWFAFLFNPPYGHSRVELLGREPLRECWPFGREEPDGHPAFYAILGLAGWYPTRGLFPPLTAHRFGPMALAAITAGAVYFHLAHRVNRVAGWTGAAALVLMPRTFAHAHYAHYDMPMTCLWLLAQMAFVRALEAQKLSRSREGQ